MVQLRDLVGQKFEKLLVIRRAAFNIGGRVSWECLCDCGNTTIVPANNLTSGNTKTCGCGKYVGFVDRTTHGLSDTPLNDMYYNMRIRCFGNHKQNKSYSAKGITLCSEWDMFDKFQKWALSNGYIEGLQIDRIRNEDGYSPENCRFINRVANSLNKSCRNKYGVIGLDYTQKDGYILRVSLKSKRKYVVGFFKDIESAGAVRNRLVDEFIEKYGRLQDSEVTEELCKNFIEEFKKIL